MKRVSKHAMSVTSLPNPSSFTSHVTLSSYMTEIVPITRPLTTQSCDSVTLLHYGFPNKGDETEN